MEFRVAHRRVDDPFALPRRLSAPRLLTPASVPTDRVERVVALVEEATGMLTLHELGEVAPNDERSGEPVIAVTDEHGTTRHFRTEAVHFEDTTNWIVAYGATEVWRFLNLSPDTHPMHVHLVQFSVLGRDRYDTSGFDVRSGATKTPVAFDAHGQVDDNEIGWKDTIRVNPGDLVTIAATFDGFTGRYMYHCHILEHEDMDMMRPFVVMPAFAMAGMGMAVAAPQAAPEASRETGFDLNPSRA